MAESGPGVVPQPVLSSLTTAAIFLVVTIDRGGEPVARELLSDLAGLQRSVGFRVPEGRLSCVAGVGSQAWDRLFGGPRPAELHPFRELAGAEHCALSTPGDLLFHIRATQLYPCFELAGQIMDHLGGAVTIRDEVHGFTYFDMRDLLGFVDGTENPVGTQRQILRDNMAFGTVGESQFGTYFIGYARTPAVTEKMLENMFLGDPPGNYDRILDFSTPVTGTLFFAPAAGFLDDLPDPPRAATTAGTGAISDVHAPSDGSLGIGDLKRSTAE